MLESSLLLPTAICGLGLLCVSVGFPLVALRSTNDKDSRYSISEVAVIGEALLVCLFYLISRLGLALGFDLLLFVVLPLLGGALAALRLDRFNSIRWIRFDFSIAAPLGCATAAIYLLSGRTFFDAWGSGDVSAYWASAEYLQHFSLDDQDWFRQQVFHNREAELHITHYGRIGVMTFLAALSSLSPFATPVPLIVPLIVFNQILCCSVFVNRLEKLLSERTPAWKRLFLLVVPILISFSPMVLFNLYYTYLSQSIAVPILFLALCTFPSKGASNGSVAQFYLLMSAASLVYEALIPLVLAIVLLDIVMGFFYEPRGLGWRQACPLLCLVLFGENLLVGLQRILFVGNNASFPGWNWTTSIGITDVIGLTSPLTVGQSVSLPWTVDLIFWSVCIYGLSRIRFTLEFSLPFVFCTATYLFSCFHVMKGTPNATHMVAKSLATFAPVIVCCFLLGILFLSANAIHRRFFPIVLVVLLGCNVYHFRIMRPQSAIVTARQSELLRSWADRGFLIQFSSAIRHQRQVRALFGPAVRNDQLLETFGGRENCFQCSKEAKASVWICLEDGSQKGAPILFARVCDSGVGTQLPF